MRAAIYARYSSDLQREASITDQVRSCKARIDKEGWALVTTYTDHAISGSIRMRPGYQKLLKDARSGELDVVRAHTARGESIHGGRKVNAAQSDVVRLIFSNFAAGNSPRRIAVALNRDHIPGPRGGDWDASTTPPEAPGSSITNFISVGS